MPKYRIRKRKKPQRKKQRYRIRKAPSTLILDKTSLKASICRDCFYDFVIEFWDTVVPEDPVWNWHIKAICDELQIVAERVFKGLPKKYDLIINVPPGSTKSTVATVLFPAWVWTRMQSSRTICASYSHPLALELSRKTRDVVKSDKWIKLFGDIKLREDQNTKGHFMNKGGGSRYSVGTNGTVTGMHGHFILVDDPINPEEAASEATIKSANRFVSQTLSTRKVDKMITVTVLIMQRLHQNDPTGALRKKARDLGLSIRHIKLPGEILPGKGRDQVRPRKYAKKYVDGLLDPVRLPRKALQNMRAELGEYGYAGQVLQDPRPPGGGMFQTHKITIDNPPPLRHMKHVVRYWDKAGTKDGGAFSVGALMAKDRSDRYWILNIVRGQWDSGTREKTIEQTATADGRRVEIGVEQEPGSGGKESAQATAKRLAGYLVRVDKPSGDKTTRADAFSVQVNNENVSMAPGPWNTEYLDELKFFPSSTYKDQVDASSGAFKLLTRHRKRAGAIL